MDERNRELLKEVIEDQLEKALASDVGDEESKQAFKEAMDAVSKQIEFDKIETSHEEQNKKLETEEKRSRREEEAKKEEARKERIADICKFGAGLVVAPLVEFTFKKTFAKMLCEFEKDYTFSTTAGRSLSSLFRFKK